MFLDKKDSEYSLHMIGELGPEDVSLIREVSSFQRVLCKGFNGVGT